MFGLFSNHPTVAYLRSLQAPAMTAHPSATGRHLVVIRELKLWWCNLQLCVYFVYWLQAGIFMYFLFAYELVFINMYLNMYRYVYICACKTYFYDYVPYSWVSRSFTFHCTGGAGSFFPRYATIFKFIIQVGHFWINLWFCAPKNQSKKKTRKTQLHLITILSKTQSTNTNPKKHTATLSQKGTLRVFRTPKKNW